MYVSMYASVFAYCIASIFFASIFLFSVALEKMRKALAHMQRAESLIKHSQNKGFGNSFGVQTRGSYEEEDDEEEERDYYAINAIKIEQSEDDGTGQTGIKGRVFVEKAKRKGQNDMHHPWSSFIFFNNKGEKVVTKNMVKFLADSPSDLLMALSRYKQKTPWLLNQMKKYAASSKNMELKKALDEFESKNQVQVEGPVSNASDVKPSKKLMQGEKVKPSTSSSSGHHLKEIKEINTGQGPGIYVDGLTLWQSQISEEEGVWATVKIPIWTVIGRYTGEYLFNEDGDYMTSREHKQLVYTPEELAQKRDAYVMAESADRVIDGHPSVKGSNIIARIQGAETRNDKKWVNIYIANAKEAMKKSKTRGLPKGVYYLASKNINATSDYPVELICDNGPAYYDPTLAEDKELYMLGEGQKWSGNFADARYENVHYDDEMHNEELYQRGYRGYRKLADEERRARDEKQMKKDKDDFLKIKESNYEEKEKIPEELISFDLRDGTTEDHYEEQLRDADKKGQRHHRKELSKKERVGLRQVTTRRIEDDPEKRDDWRLYQKYVDGYLSTDAYLADLDKEGQRKKNNKTNGSRREMITWDNWHYNNQRPDGWIGGEVHSWVEDDEGKMKKRVDLIGGELYPIAIPRKKEGKAEPLYINNPTSAGMEWAGYDKFEIDRMARIEGKKGERETRNKAARQKRKEQEEKDAKKSPAQKKRDETRRLKLEEQMKEDAAKRAKRRAKRAAEDKKENKLRRKVDILEQKMKEAEEAERKKQEEEAMQADPPPLLLKKKRKVIKDDDDE